MHSEPQALEAMTPARSADAMYAEAARDMAPIGYLWWDGRREFHASQEALALLGRPSGGDLSMREFHSLIRRSRLPELKGRWREAVQARQRCVEIELPCVLKGGRLRFVRAVSVNEYDPTGRVCSSVTALQEVTRERKLQATLEDAHARLDAAQQMANLGSWEWDFLRCQASYSAEAARIFGMAPGTTLELSQLAALVPPDQRERVQLIFENAVRHRLGTLSYDYSTVDASGRRRELHGRASIRYDRDGMPNRLLGTIQDVTELREHHRQVHTQTFLDTVTELPNRGGLIDRIQKALAQTSDQTEAGFGLLRMGLDQFGNINDSLGHAVGDVLLKMVGQRFAQALREGDTVARLGADGFAVLVPEVRQADVMARVASKLLQALTLPFSVNGADVFVTARVGAALYPADGHTALELLQRADAALSHAKARGRSHVEFYSPQLTEQASHRLMMESELRKGVERHELLLHYQPKFELGTQRLVGAEALMRWCQPQRGMISPLSFIPLAEETGLIVRMGTWALHESCKAVVAWNRQRTEPLKIAVNLSARQFGDSENLLETVQGALSATGCKPEWLELEITESLLLDGSDGVRLSLETLAAMGITIAIDDFGTGYSALGYLMRLPVQTLKIDRSFVSDLPDNKRSGELVKAIVSVGKSLGMELVAEGVETPEQAAYLRSIGCHLAQGYLFGRPVEMAAFDKLVIAG